MKEPVQLSSNRHLKQAHCLNDYLRPITFVYPGDPGGAF